MALCKFSSELAVDNFTIVDNVFINDYLPSAPDYCVKVYLYGLYQCTTQNDFDNSIVGMCHALSVEEGDLFSAFSYWQELGLIQIVSKDPVEIKYLPVKIHAGSLKKYKSTKYKDFNTHIEQLITERPITPNEFNEYYTFIETNHFDPKAFLMVVKYCLNLKGGKINYPYILTVARSFSADGIKTEEVLEEYLLDQEKNSKELKDVLKALGIKRDADAEERRLYSKWIKNFGFAHGVVVEAAKLEKCKSISALDIVLSKLYELKLFSIKEIVENKEQKEKLFELAKNISKTIGVFYQVLDNVVETYITDWLNKGFSEECLLTIADYCFKHSIRTYEGMSSTINKFSKLGLITLPAISQYISNLVSTDKDIQSVLDEVGLVRGVNSWDRDFYRTWTYTWNFDISTILKCAKVAKNKSQPMQYLTKMLSAMHDQNVNSEQKIDEFIANWSKSSSDTQNNAALQFETRTYTKQELDALFDSLDDVEV